MKYISFILLIFLNCKDFNSKSVNNNDAITKIEIEYKGDIDKPLPVIVLCGNCKEHSDFTFYSFQLNKMFFKAIANHTLSFKTKKEKRNDTVLSVSIDTKKTNYFFLDREDAKSLIKEIITESSYKKDKTLNDQLKRYFNILNK